MNRLFGYAISRTGFHEESGRPLPELVIGSAPGMSTAVIWAYRNRAHLSTAQGAPKEIVEAFSNVPLRSLDADVVSRHAVDTAWIVTSLGVRRSARPDLVRVVALGKDGEGSILFEANTLTSEAITSMQRNAIGRSLREVLAMYPSVDDSLF